MSIRSSSLLACVSLAFAGALVAAGSTPQGWEESWTIDLSRGASVEPVWVDSMLLVASLDRNVHLVRLGDRPEVVWDGNFDGGFQAEPVVTGDRIYLAETARGRRLLALRRLDRTVAWTAKAGDQMASPVIDPAGERVYSTSSSGEVTAWSPGGEQVWRTELKSRIAATPRHLGDALVVATSDGRFFALDPVSGAVRDSLDPDAGAIWAGPIASPSDTDAAIWATLDGQLLEVRGDLEIPRRRSFPSRFTSGPVASGGTIYLVGHEGTAWAYDWEAAEVLWQQEMGGTFRARPAVGEAVIAIGDLAGTLHVIDRRTGERIWHTRLNGAVTAPAATRGDHLFVVTRRGRLYALQPTD